MKSGFERIGRTVTLQSAQRSCLDKKRYANRNDARDAATKVEKKFPGSSAQHPYRCTLCSGFHLATKRKKNDRRNRT